MRWRPSRRRGRKRRSREEAAGGRADVIRLRLVALALLLATGACGVVASRVAPEVDLRTLRESLDRLSPALAGLAGWRAYEASAAPFAIGLVVGGCAALWWAHGRLRWRSVLLVDNRQPDMTLEALLAHVQRHASRSGPEALGLIAGAARAGALSIWSGSASGAMRRLPRRLVKTALTRHFEGMSDGPGQAIAPRNELFFVQTEVRLLWPAARSIVIAGRTALRRGDS